MRLTTESKKEVKPVIMAVPKIESEGRTCGQKLLSPAWAVPSGLQPVAVAQNRADTEWLLQGCLGKAGEKHFLLPSSSLCTWRAGLGVQH